MKDLIIKKGLLSGFVDEFANAFGRKELSVKDVTFVVTQDCTLRCTYCYETNKNKEHEMTLETGKKIVDMMFEEDAKNSKIINSKNAQAVIMDFIGGEPLLRIHLIDQIMEYFLKKAVSLNHRWAYNYNILLTTNGTEYFTRDVQKFMFKYKGRASIAVTVDGNKELHDKCRRFVDGRPSYDIANRALIDSLEKGCTSNTKMTISRENLPYLYEAIVNMLNYPNMDTVAANVVFEAKWTIDDSKLFYSELKKIADYSIKNEIYSKIAITLFDETIGHPKDPNSKDDNKNWCGGGAGVMLAFDSNGDIYPCLRFLPFSLRFRSSEFFRLGNLETGILKTREQKHAKDILDNLTRKSQSTEECYNCPIAGGCAWCSAWNYDLYGTVNKRCTFICPTHKARVLANSYYWNTLYRMYGMPKRFKLDIPKEWALEIVSEDEYNMLKALSEEGELNVTK